MTWLNRNHRAGIKRGQYLDLSGLGRLLAVHKAVWSVLECDLPAPLIVACVSMSNAGDKDRCDGSFDAVDTVLADSRSRCCNRDSHLNLVQIRLGTES